MQNKLISNSKFKKMYHCIRLRNCVVIIAWIELVIFSIIAGAFYWIITVGDKILCTSCQYATPGYWALVGFSIAKAISSFFALVAVFAVILKFIFSKHSFSHSIYLIGTSLSSFAMVNNKCDHNVAVVSVCFDFGRAVYNVLLCFRIV